MDDAQTAQIERTEPTALAVLPAASISRIVAADKADILGSLAAKVRRFREGRPDASKAGDRDEMRTLAYEIAKSKTALVKIGKTLTEDWRASTKAVNDECKLVEDRLDELRDEVRAPLTAWEQREKDRVAAHETALADLASFGQFPPEWPSQCFAERLTEIRDRGLMARAWEEFEPRAVDLHAEITDKLRNGEVVAHNREAEAAELAALRAERAERARIEALEAKARRDTEIAAAAAEQARQEANAAYARKMEEAQAEAQREIAREQEAARQILAAQEEKAAAEKAERERLEQAIKDAAEKAEADRLAAIERERLASERAEREKLAAIAAERARVAREEAAQKAKEDERAADLAHRGQIHRAIMQALVTVIAEVHAGTAEEAATMGKALVTALAKRTIPHTRIDY